MKLRFFNTGFPKINLVFSLVIIIVVTNVAFNYYIIHKNKARVEEMSEVINPYIEALSEFNLMVTESKMYATNWVYLQNNLEDKKSLADIHQRRFKAIKAKLDHYAMQLHLKANEDSLVDVFLKFYKLMEVQKRVMTTLVSFDDYENAQKKFQAEEIIESEVLPQTQAIMIKLNRIIARSRSEADRMKREIERDSAEMTTMMLLTSLGLLVFVIFAVVFISTGIRRPVLRMREIVQRLARGEPANEKLKTKNDVIGQMLSSINALSESFTKTSEFANEIGKGNLSVPYEKLSEKDVLGNALINMQNSLKAYSEDMEEKVRQRTIEVLEKGRKLELAYNEIKDSINYAKRIQEAILPAPEIISEVFSNFFIFYRPKDVVCGDFYWFFKTDKDIVIAAVDCTGHGVPGALMTVIGNSLLNQVVTFSGITSPSDILVNLDKKLEETLKQHGGIATNDGMDMAVCHYRVGDNMIRFAGAKRPLYLFRNKELMEIKGSNAPIGSYGHNIEKKFAEHVIKVKKDDTLYLFSDGLQDQFGGSEGKKYMIKRFRDMLQKIQGFPMHDQKAHIEKEMSTWQEGYEQTDDMLLIGIRF